MQECAAQEHLLLKLPKSAQAEGWDSTPKGKSLECLSQTQEYYSTQIES
jgi:hypothetical protein